MRLLIIFSTMAAFVAADADVYVSTHLEPPTPTPLLSPPPADKYAAPKETYRAPPPFVHEPPPPTDKYAAPKETYRAPPPPQEPPAPAYKAPLQAYTEPATVYSVPSTVYTTPAPPVYPAYTTAPPAYPVYGTPAPVYPVYGTPPPVYGVANRREKNLLDLLAAKKKLKRCLLDKKCLLRHFLHG